MLLRARLVWLCCGVLGASSVVCCGARTSIYLSDAGAEQPTLCATDMDCATGDACAPAMCHAGTCVAAVPISCSDGDPCTRDSCDPDTGACSFTPVTLDLDGDGHRSPKPGFAPGAPGSCGDDCDDRSAAAHPGATETCDGVDNDCNGKVDDGAVYGAATAPVRVSSSAFDRAASGGLAFDGKRYGATFSGHQQRYGSYFTALSGAGVTVVPETPISDINSETYAGQLLHNGSYFESVWADARQGGNYEIYFNRYDSNGHKLAADLRVSNGKNFSLDPSLAWNGTETLLVWDDRRFEQAGLNDVRIFGQRIAFDGSLVGSNVQLTNAGTQAEDPGIAVGQKRVGIVYAAQVTPIVTRLKFFSTAPDLSAPSPTVDLAATDVESPTLVALGSRFVVAWQVHGQSYGPSIFGAVLDESGQVVVPQQPITSGAQFARTYSLLSLGDRVVLVWVDDHDGNYEMYEEVLDENLKPRSPRTRLTFTDADTLSPVAAFGPNGELGVLYEDWQSGERQTYFLNMSCSMGGGDPVK